MQYAFLPVFLFAACALALAVALLAITGLINPGRPGRVTRMPYESGMDPVHDTRRRFDVRFHLLAIAFLIFDVELLFLYPWAVASRPAHEQRIRDWGLEIREPQATGDGALLQTPIPGHQSPSDPQGIDAAVAKGHIANRHLVFVGVMTFLLLLTLGFVYDWRKGIFRWR